MARTRRDNSIDDKIEKAQEKVVCSKAKYDAAVTEFKQLMERKDAIQKEALMNAIANSSRSHDEILAFLKGNVRQE